MRYVIYCDESSAEGKYYSNFYGGALIRASDRQRIESELQAEKDRLNIFNGEMKWTKITDRYEQKYIEFLEKFFELVLAGDVKIRIMFTQNINTRPPLQVDSGNEYFMLYYQFLKHAFGFRYSPHSQSDRAEVEVLLDDVPQKKEDFEQFKDYLSSLSVYPYFRQKGVSIRRESIGSIDSKNHNILQAVDLVLGAMHFRLNDLHLAKPEGQRTRGKRTRSKERVYKKVNSLIRTIYPGFNIGTSTGQKNGATDRWNHPYRHWLFVPSDSKVDLTRAKGRGK